MRGRINPVGFRLTLKNQWINKTNIVEPLNYKNNLKYLINIKIKLFYLLKQNNIVPLNIFINQNNYFLNVHLLITENLKLIKKLNLIISLLKKAYWSKALIEKNKTNFWKFFLNKKKKPKRLKTKLSFYKKNFFKKLKSMTLPIKKKYFSNEFQSISISPLSDKKNK